MARGPRGAKMDEMYKLLELKCGLILAANSLGFAEELGRVHSRLGAL